ncbi:MAG: phosphatase PAP2 family protein [Patescibacteria group bacterium]|nr:phosphatase PAP2 family protein [Patescibacteria group bacterium]
MRLDLTIFKFIHSLAGKSICLDSLGIFLAVYLIWLMPLLICFIWFLKGEKRKILKILFLCFLAVVLVYLFDFIFEKIYFRPRPFVVLNLLSLINVGMKESSFPSAHTAIAFALAFSIYFFHYRLGIIFLILALFIGLARIFVGVHWPTDVLAGIFIGWFGALLTKKLFTRKLITQ